MGVVLVIAGPALAQAAAGRSINPNNATLALALTATVIGLLTSVFEESASADLAGLLWPGLAALMGLLLLLPQPVYGSWRPWLGIVSMPILVGSGAFLVARKDPVRDRVPRAMNFHSAWGLVASGVVCAAMALARGRLSLGSGFWSASGLDGLVAALTIVSLRRLGAVRWCAQFAVVPLLAMIEGILFLRPILDLRSWVGMGLLAVGAGYQLLLTRGASESGAGYQVTPRVPSA